MNNVASMIIFFLIGFPVLLFALITAELARGLMAEKLGDPTPRMMGRLTLNPAAHIDLIGLILMVLTLLAGFGIGFAKPMPVNPTYFPNYRKGVILYALAGSMMNACLALFGLGWLYLFYTMNANLHPLFAFALNYWVIINCVLIVFSLLPIPGYYGGLILAELLPHPLGQQFGSLARYGFIIFFALLFLGVFRWIWMWTSLGLTWVLSTVFGSGFTAWAGFSG